MSRFISYLNSCNCRISSSKEELKKESENHPPLLTVYYNILDISTPIKVCDDGSSMKSMEVDGKLLNSVVTEYLFNSVGEHIIKYEFNDPTRIGDGAFYGSVGLKSVIIPDNITIIGTYAFGSCVGLTSVTIGNGVRDILLDAFSSIDIEIVTIKATTPPTIAQTIFSGNKTKIYVPAESVDAYKLAKNWSTYADKIFPIE